MTDNITLPREVVQEPVASDDDEEFTREDVTTLLLEVMDWTYAKAHRNRPMTEAEQKVLNDISTALAAEQPKPSEEAEALRRDAERYRWMATGDTRRRVCNILPLFNAYAYRKEHIDAAIDAAMGDKR